MAASSVSVKQLVVTLSGGWDIRVVPRLDGKTQTIRTWAGKATSSEALVAAVVVGRPGFSSWGKSQITDMECAVKEQAQEDHDNVGDRREELVAEGLTDGL
jgi:hypothetical protein